MTATDFDLIEINPRVLLGQPVIKGTRLPVYAIVDSVAEGDSMQDILDAFPFLTDEAFRQALRFAARMSRMELEEA